MGGDEAVDLAEEERVLWLEELDLGYPRTSIFSGDGGFGLGVDVMQDDEGDVVAGVPAHDVRRGGRPVKALDLAVARVLDHHGRRVRRLAVPHAHVSRAPVPQRSPTAARVFVSSRVWILNSVEKDGLGLVFYGGAETRGRGV